MVALQTLASVEVQHLLLVVLVAVEMVVLVQAGAQVLLTQAVAVAVEMRM